MRIPRALLRVLALVLLAVMLVGVPAVVFRLVGIPLPSPDELRHAWGEHRIDTDLVVRIGAAVSAVLWLWFAVTAVAELAHVTAWRLGGSAVRLAPIPPGPSGWVRALVRFVVVSSVSATATFGSFVPLARASVAPVASRPSSAVAATHAVGGSLMTGHFHRSVGRETPYSLANTLGRPGLREAIIELNLGRPGPDGAAWEGGVFPAGMEVALPEVPVVQTPLGPAHQVVAGDSYWRIADEHLAVALQREATPPEVMAYTEALVSFNRDLLGHRDPTMIMPGELVVLAGAAPVDGPVAETPAQAAEAPPTIPRTVELPDVHAWPVTAAEQVTATGQVTAVAPGHVDAAELADPGQGSTAEVVPAAPAEQQAGEQASAGDDRSGLLPATTGLGAALMVSAGALGLIETRRRRQLRAAGVGDRLARPSATQVHTEVLLRSLSGAERLARLDLALRAAAPALAAQAASVLAAIVSDDGEVCLFLRGCATPDDLAWKLDPHANTWRLSGGTSLTALAPRARLSAQPCPAIVHLGGVPEGGELFVDLEAVGTLAVDSPQALPILRNIAASLSVSPFVDVARVFSVGLGDVSLGASSVEQVESLDAALDAAAMALGSTGQLTRDATTFGLRVAGAGGEAWEPAIVVAAVGGCGGQSAPGLADGDRSDCAAALHGEVLAAAGGGRGLAVVTDLAPDAVASDGGWHLRVDDDGQHLLEPLGLRVHPVGLSGDDVAQLTDLVHGTEQSFQRTPPPAPSQQCSEWGTTGAAIVEPAVAFAEPEWALLVRLFGQVQVTSMDGTLAECERSKAVELIVWLGQHRERPTRTAARTALWDLDVRDATFANVVSDARRAMARAVAPSEGEEWLARTLTEDLPLHPRVVTDAEVLEARLQHARGLPSLDAVEVLRPGVELLGGMPFAGTNYLWTDAEGITSSLILLATGAAIELANHYLLLGDVDGVFWATGQGLKVLSGHEELISLRMRAHARRGDLAGVRGEWESYERAIAADPWAAAEPAPKLVALRRELMAPSARNGAG